MGPGVPGGAEEGDDGGGGEKRTRLRPGAEGGPPGEHCGGEGAEELGLVVLGRDDAESVRAEVGGHEALNFGDAKKKGVGKQAGGARQGCLGIGGCGGVEPRGTEPLAGA